MELYRVAALNPDSFQIDEIVLNLRFFKKVFGNKNLASYPQKRKQ